MPRYHKSRHYEDATIFSAIVAASKNFGGAGIGAFPVKLGLSLIEVSSRSTLPRLHIAFPIRHPVASQPSMMFHTLRSLFASACGIEPVKYALEMSQSLERSELLQSASAMIHAQGETRGRFQEMRK